MSEPFLQPTTSASEYQQNGGMTTIKGEQKSAHECYTESLKPFKTGSDIPDNVRPELVSFLKNKSTCFDWSHFDMTDIDANIITHKLNIDTFFKPVRQKRRKFAPERNTIIKKEVDKLLDIGMIKEVMYPEWLANVVVVQKKNGRVAALNRFISRSSERCRLFYNLVRKNKSFKWMPEHEIAFQELKTYMATPPLLAKPNKGEPPTVYLSVTETAVSGVLTKEIEG
ncbi:uncharacterized protein LOC141608205 [Silene latifolia]|uniref:uncharacterized protein LOC141608205 n=1 Tax=Silene latifolia TaxID=37657 RepID=UPI003D7888F8